MTGPASWNTLMKDSATRSYVAISLAAQLVILVLMMRRGFGPWTFLPIALAILGIVVRTHFAPLVVFVVLSAVLYMQDPFRQGVLLGPYFRRFSLPDWVLCGAVLAYFAAYYRFLGLVSSLLPHEARTRTVAASKTPTVTQAEEERRKPRPVAPLEVSWLGLSLPIWAFSAQVCLMLASVGATYMGFRERSRQQVLLSQGVLFVMILCAALLLAAAVFSYVGLQRWSRRQARLYLQDVLWQETRREQRRLYRWLTWARRERP
jgi:hypothetical protein